MKLIIILFVVIHVAYTWRGFKVLIDEFSVDEFNSEYVQNLTVGVHKSKGFMYLHLKKAVNSPINVHLLAYQKTKESFDHLAVNSTVDLCKYFKNPKMYPIMQTFYSSLAGKGNFPKQCPTKTGTYILHDVTVNEENLPAYVPGEHWKLTATIQENATPIYKITGIFTIDHSPGMEKFIPLLSRK